MSMFFREGREKLMEEEGLKRKPRAKKASAQPDFACPHCSQAPVIATAKFCPYCGKPVVNPKSLAANQAFVLAFPKRLAYFIALHDQLERELVKVPLGKDLDVAIRNMEQRLEHCPDGDKSLKIAKRESKKDHYKVAALAMIQRAT